MYETSGSSIRPTTLRHDSTIQPHSAMYIRCTFSFNLIPPKTKREQRIRLLSSELCVLVQPIRSSLSSNGKKKRQPIDVSDALAQPNPVNDPLAEMMTNLVSLSRL